jgi:asparagine synthase (glutamine-hydrolysing)
MCGIAGVIDFTSNKRAVDQDILRSMSDVIIHRGPDSGGEWISDDHTCGFGFRRLSIVDLSKKGDQPMRSEDGRYTIVFNGEIYNHEQIRQDLISKGYSYKSHTDTETILNGFIEYGEEILTKMVGMWALAIWDDYEKKLFAARDRIGIKPFYYHYKNGKFIFASEIKSILQHPYYSPEPDFSEFPNYLNYGSSTRNNTMFQSISKLPAAHFIRISKDLKHEQKYWHLLDRKPPSKDIRPRDIETNVLSLLRQSVKSRMMSDVPFGVFLSGGLDSSLNVALMAELMDRPVNTFTVGFKELSQFNELQYANKVSNLFSTNHNEILIDHDDALPALNDIIWHQDEPNADPVCIPLYFLSKLTKSIGTTVVQVGEGSDEQFVGYKWMMRDFNFYNTYWKLYNKLPGFASRAIYNTFSPLLASAGQYLAAEYLRKASYNEEFYWGGVPIIPKTLQSILLLDSNIDLSKPANYAHELHNEAINECHQAEYIQRMFFVELKQRLAELLLMRVDKMTMAHSLEARVPFLDHRLVEYTAGLTASRKIYAEQLTKVILKKASEEVLPLDIIYRKKMGFAAPISNWLKGPLHRYASEKLNDSPLAKSGYFNSKLINSMLDQHKRGKKDHGNQIYSLLVLHLWYEKFFR